MTVVGKFGAGMYEYCILVFQRTVVYANFFVLGYGGETLCCFILIV